MEHGNQKKKIEGGQAFKIWLCSRRGIGGEDVVKEKESDEEEEEEGGSVKGESVELTVLSQNKIN